MLILVPIAFVAGVITAFTPCILPVLPIVLAGGVGGATKRRPYAIAAGLVATFTAFLLAGACSAALGAGFFLARGFGFFASAGCSCCCPSCAC